LESTDETTRTFVLSYRANAKRLTASKPVTSVTPETCDLTVLTPAKNLPGRNTRRTPNRFYRGVMDEMWASRKVARPNRTFPVQFPEAPFFALVGKKSRISCREFRAGEDEADWTT